MIENTNNLIYRRNYNLSDKTNSATGLIKTPKIKALHGFFNISKVKYIKLSL